MAKTYPLKALWPLLPFEVTTAPLLATLDAYGGGLVKYAVSQDGIWLFSLAQPLSVDESENLTGFHPADLVPKQIDGVEGYFYAMQGGAPLLPLPFTKDQLIAFEKRMAGLIGSCIERGDDTDAWIADLEKDNPDAAELARGIHGNQWPLDLADIVETKKEGVAKPRFRLSDGIELNASTMAFKSAYDEAQRQTDMLKSMGITPDLLKQIDYQKDMEKLIGSAVGSMANAAYMDEIKRAQDMLRIANPSASELVADALGRQFASTVGLGTAADSYHVSQATTRVDMEKLIGGSISGLADTVYQKELQRNQDMLRAVGPYNSELAAATLGRPFASTVGIDTAANAYLQCETAARAEMEKAIGGSLSTAAQAMSQHDALGYVNTVANAYRQADYIKQTELERSIAMVSGGIADSTGRVGRAGLDAALGLYHQPTAKEMFEQMELERLEKAIADDAHRERVIEFTPPPFFDHHAAISRQREDDREHAIETARLAEIARLEARDEYEARKQATSPTPAPNTTPVGSDGATAGVGNERVVPSWSLTVPKRFQGYSKPLYDHLKAAHGAGKTRPTARNVLDDWKLNRPHEVAEISNDGLKYYDASGNTKPADLAAIRKAIDRMTT